MHSVCIKVNLSIFKDSTNKKMSFIWYLRSKEMFTKRKQVLKEMFMKREQVLKNVLVFMCRKAPFEYSEENPTLVGDLDYLQG